MSAHDRTEPVYMISVVASLTEMHPQTIRLYDRMGLVNPQRKNKNRLYSEADVDRLKQIRRLTQDMGVNLAGVEVILEMMDRLRILQGENESLIDRCREIEDGVREYLARTGGKVP